VAARSAYVAVQDGTVVGHVPATRGWLDAPHALVEVLVLSPLSVCPDWQRRGIDSQPVGHLLAIAQQLKCALHLIHSRIIRSFLTHHELSSR
jgi:putative acetyltransferase